MSGSPFRVRNASHLLNEELASPSFSFSSSSGHRYLLTREQVQQMLQLAANEVQHLIDTRQIALILIEGKERFCSNDLGRLIDQYLQTARRAA